MTRQLIFVVFLFFHFAGARRWHLGGNSPKVWNHLDAGIIATWSQFQCFSLISKELVWLLCNQLDFDTASKLPQVSSLYFLILTEKKDTEFELPVLTRSIDSLSLSWKWLDGLKSTGDFKGHVHCLNPTLWRRTTSYHFSLLDALF